MPRVMVSWLLSRARSAKGPIASAPVGIDSGDKSINIPIGVTARHSHSIDHCRWSWRFEEAIVSGDMMLVQEAVQSQ